MSILNLHKPLSLVDFDKFFVGFDGFFKDLNDLYHKVPSYTIAYPPHNILKTEDGYTVKMAVAGFSSKDIEVTIEENDLVIKGNKETSEDEESYIYRGLASRSFTKSFRLGDHLDHDSVEASVENGILTITVKNKAVEEVKNVKTIKVKG